MIIAISNQKGGVGKTTTSVTFAAAACRAGMRTLLIDLDSQGNVADSLGMGAGRELAAMLNPMLPADLAECTVPARHNLSVIRSDKTTAALKTVLGGMDFREMVLRDALHNHGHDLVLLDCAPSVDVLLTAALVVADMLIIPTRLDQLALKGVRDVLGSAMELQRAGRSHISVIRVLPTFYDRSTRESQSQFEHLARSFSELLLPPIPTDTSCREATRAGQTLFEYRPDCRALRGVQVAGKLHGGYEQAFNRLQEVM